VAMGDYLCSIAMNEIHFSIAFPIYAGMGLAVGSALVYGVDRQGDPAKIFVGVFMAILAILSLAAAETQPSSVDDEERIKASTDYSTDYSTEAGEEKNVHISKSTNSNKGYEDVRSPLHCEAEVEVASEVSAVVVVQSQSTTGSAKKETGHWVQLCFFCGLLCGLWCPMSSLGRTQRGVTSPLIALVIFQFGQLMTVPVQMFSYSTVLYVMERDPEKRKIDATSSANNPFTFLLDICNASKWDLCVGLLTGSVVGIGYTLYFITSSSINPTVALAIPSCEPLMTILIGVCVTRTLRLAPLKAKLLYLAAFCFFVAAISLLAIAV